MIRHQHFEQIELHWCKLQVLDNLCNARECFTCRVPKVCCIPLQCTLLTYRISGLDDGNAGESDGTDNGN